jgi:predicted amidophosphoribosyltransferase
MPSADRLTQVDSSVLGDHLRLAPDDKCYFWREYTSHENYSFSSTNQLISNLKKKPTRPAQELRYKAQAIRECAAFFRGAINPDWLQTATLVPVPSSKAHGHPDYDDRMSQVCRLIGPQLDVRELVYQAESTQAAHESCARPGVSDLLRVYRINEQLVDPVPTRIGVFDDLLTAGTHFRAMSTILGQRFPQASIVGFFIARRVFANPTGSLLDSWP